MMDERERLARAVSILRPIAEAMMPLRGRLDYEHRTSPAGRACLDAYDALHAEAPAHPSTADDGDAE